MKKLNKKDSVVKVLDGFKKECPFFLDKIGFWYGGCCVKVGDLNDMNYRIRTVYAIGMMDGLSFDKKEDILLILSKQGYFLK